MNIPELSERRSRGSRRTLGVGAALLVTVAVACGEPTGPDDPEPVSNLVLAQSSITLGVGGASGLSAAVISPAGDTTRTDGFSWATDQPAIARVDQLGFVTGVAPGTASITAQADGLTATATVAVTNSPSTLVDSVRLTPDTATIAGVGTTLQFMATAFDASGAPLPSTVFVWTAAGVISVDPSTGAATTTAHGYGTITATTSDGSSVSASITVPLPSTSPTASVSIFPDGSLMFGVGDTLRFRATALSADSIPIADKPLLWVSSDPALLTVDSTGLATATGFGDAEIFASTEGITTAVPVTVFGRLSRVEISLGIDTLLVRDRSELIGTVRDEADAAVPLEISWSVSDTSLAVVDSDEVVIGVAPGLVTVTASAMGLSEQVDLVVDTLPPIVSVTAAGAGQDIPTCSLHDNGRIYCWGTTGVGHKFAPAGVASPEHFTSVTAGGPAFIIGYWKSHLCAIASDDSAWCWGRNTGGQLGDGTTSKRTTPTPVSGGLSFTKLSAASSQTCGLTPDGSTYCWGGGVSVPTAVSGAPPFVDISLGVSHRCGIASDASAYCWNNNSRGELGNGSTTPSLTPQMVAGGLAFRAIAAGFQYTCGITTSDETYCWGDNSQGQLGDGTQVNRSTPRRVSTDPGFAQISTGSHHTCALTMSGTAYCWGKSEYGELGTGVRRSFELLPVPVQDAPSFSQITVSAEHSCGVTPEGDAFCWGRGTWGSLGTGLTESLTTPAFFESTPVPVAGRR